MSTFSGLNIALTSLYAQRRGLEVTGDNISNVNTDGYSRQRVDLEQLGGPTTGLFFSGTQRTGNGVMVAGYTRFRDAFLETRAALEHGAQSSLTQVSNALGQMESLFAEPSDQGIAAGLNNFWAGWGDVANNPSDAASRQQLLGRASTLAANLNNASQELAQLGVQSTAQLAATIQQVNTDAANVAKLNGEIASGTASGLNVNDLLDQRDKLVQKLSNSIGATIRGGDNGSVNVFVNGSALVSQNLAQSLALDTTGPSAVVRWASGNFPATVNSGDAGGLLEVINNKVPGYQANLDAIATKLRDDVNGVHAAMSGSIAVANQDQSANGSLQFQVALNGGGFATAAVAGADWSGPGGAAALQSAMQAAIDLAIGAGKATVTVSGGAGQPLSVNLAGSGSNSVQVQTLGANTGFATLLGNTPVGLDGIGGRKFFDGTGAKDFAVSSDVASNPDAIGAGAAGGGAFDGSVALDLADAGGSQTGADSLYRSLIVGLGIDSQNTQNRSDIQSAAVKQVDAARQSASGVNTDEEMVSMLQYQHAYEAAARFMTAVDATLQTLISSTGLVGR
jgi:flagellar hook-associated protein FlgK